MFLTSSEFKGIFEKFSKQFGNIGAAFLKFHIYNFHRLARKYSNTSKNIKFSKFINILELSDNLTMISLILLKCSCVKRIARKFSDIFKEYFSHFWEGLESKWISKKCSFRYIFITVLKFYKDELWIFLWNIPKCFKQISWLLDSCIHITKNCITFMKIFVSMSKSLSSE